MLLIQTQETLLAHLEHRLACFLVTTQVGQNGRDLVGEGEIWIHNVLQ